MYYENNAKKIKTIFLLFEVQNEKSKQNWMGGKKRETIVERILFATNEFVFVVFDVKKMNGEQFSLEL